MIKYFVYEFKRRIPVAIALTLAALGLTLGFAFRSWDVEWNNLPMDRYDLNYIFTDTTATQTVALGVISIILPVYLFAPFCVKSGADLFYSLPISKVKLYFAESLVGIAYMFISYAVFYWISSAVLMYRLSEWSNWAYIPNFFMNFILAVPMYGLSAFLFTRGKNITDGIVNIALAFAAVWLTGQGVCTCIYNGGGAVAWEFYYFLPFEPMDFSTTVFQDYMLEQSRADEPLRIVMVIFHIICGLSGFFGLFYGLKFSKAEELGGITDSVFAYKTFIPVCMFSGNLLLSCSDLNVLAVPNVVATVAGFFMYCIYRKTFRLRWYDYAALFASGIAGTLVGILA